MRNQELNVAKATVKSPENSDLIRNWFSLCEMLCYKCNQRFFNSVKFRKHTYKILTFMANGAMEDEDQMCMVPLRKTRI